jgi:lipopolysaccharide export system protein LptA
MTMTTRISQRTGPSLAILCALLGATLAFPAGAQTGKPATTAVPGTPARAAPAAKPAPAAAATTAASPAKTPDRPSAFGELGSNKAPINIDSDRLDVFNKDGRAVFTGNVVAVQGDSTMRCTILNVFYEQERSAGAAGKPAPAGGGGMGTMGGNSSIKKIECRGPVTVVSKTQVATGDNAEFDRTGNKVYLTGNVAVSEGPNVTRGERLVYDLNSGTANIETKPGGRVRALFVPGSGDKKP